MRKFVIGAVVAAGVVAAPANARDGSVYVGVEGGVTTFGDVGMEVNGTSDAMNVTTNAGWEYGVLAGYDFGLFRLEAEGARKSAKMQQLRRTATGFDVDEVTPGVQELASVDGDIDVDSLMVNAMLDTGDGGLSAYAGGGIGYAWTKTAGQIAGVVGPFVDDSDNGFAWQLIAGIGVPITSGVELGARYRYFNVGGIGMTSPRGRTFDTDYQTHSVLATLLFHFGGDAALPPPPPPVIAPPPSPPPPPPPPQTRTCPGGQVVLVSQPCPAPPPPQVPPTGERG